MRSWDYIYYCGLVLGWQLQLITTQYEEPFSTEFTTETIWNETELNFTAIPYRLPFPEQNDLFFGMPGPNIAASSFNASNDTDGSTTVEPDVGMQNATVKLRIKAPASEYQYSYNEIDYQLPPSYNYDYGSLAGSSNNGSVFNRSVIPPIISHIAPISPYAYSLFGNQFQSPLKASPMNGFLGSTKSDNKSHVLGIGSPYSLIQPRLRSPPVMPTVKTKSSSTLPTKSFRTKMADKATVASAKKRTLTTRRTKKTTSTRTTSSKRFRAVAQQSAQAQSIHSKPPTVRKLRTRVPMARAKPFRSVRRSRTPRRRKPTKQRRFRNQRRTKPTVRKSPIARPRMRKTTQRPRAFPPQFFDYDYILF